VVGLFCDTCVCRYRVYTNASVKSEWRNFVAAPDVGPQSNVSFLVFGDMGVRTPFEFSDTFRGHIDQQHAAEFTYPFIDRYVAEGVPGFNFSRSSRMTSETHKRTARRWGAAAQAPTNEARMILNIGDIAYARGAGIVWDYFMHAIEKSAASAAWMVNIGNHEFDTPSNEFALARGDDSNGECGRPYSARFHMPPPLVGVPVKDWRDRNLYYVRTEVLLCVTFNCRA
jgi:hypothetical protein